MAVGEALNQLTQNSDTVFLTVQVAVDGYAFLKFKGWTEKNL